MFEIEGKVAIITGGASGIGLRYAKELLRSGLKAVTISDINESYGEKALAEISQEFGPGKVIFVEADVTNKSELEDVFKKTVEVHKQLDIVINNAGILNDAIWEKEVAINVNAVIQGTLFALHEYLPKYKSSEEGVIVNIASVAGLAPFEGLPVYVATKYAVVGLSTSFGGKMLYEKTKIKVITLCPGITDTPLISEMYGRNFGPQYQEALSSATGLMPTQTPESVAKAMVKIIREAESGTVWVAEGGKEAYEVPFRHYRYDP